MHPAPVGHDPPVRPDPSARCRRADPAGDTGAQALELVMATPVVLVLVMLVVAAGQIALGLLSTHQSAALAARLAATRDDAAVVDDLARPDVDVSVTPATGARRPGDLLTATVTRRLDVLWLPAGALTLQAQATALTEQTPPAGPPDPARRAPGSDP